MGRPQFQLVVASSPSENVSYLSNPQSANIASGGSEQITFLSPAGTITILWGAHLQCAAPAGATAGYHGYYMQVPPGDITVLYGMSNYGDEVEFSSGEWFKATNDMRPSSTQPQNYWAGKVIMDDLSGLAVVYTNETTATQTNTRLYQFAGTQVIPA